MKTRLSIVLLSGCLLTLAAVLTGTIGASGGAWNRGAMVLDAEAPFRFAVDIGVAREQVRFDPLAPERRVPSVWLEPVVEEVTESRTTLGIPPGVVPPERSLPTWARARNSWDSRTKRPSHAGARAIYWREEGYGWPWVCFSLARVQYEEAGPFRLSDGLPLSSGDDRSFAGTSGPRPIMAIPTRPHWPGLLRSWAAWSAIAGFVWIVPAEARRRSRYRRGKCPRCGFNLKGNHHSGCPECGWNRD
jgi:hypothetical protein